MKTNDKKIHQEIDAIKKTLELIEGYMCWLIKPDVRFQIGQRVEWSRHGRKSRFPRRKCAQRGTIEFIEGFSVKVKLDGITRIKTFHHSFFNPVQGPKLF